MKRWGKTSPGQCRELKVTRTCGSHAYSLIPQKLNQFREADCSWLGNDFFGPFHQKKCSTEMNGVFHVR